MSKVNKPTREQAQEAVRTLIAWAGDNPDREGLIETPKRVVNAYQDFFSGYQEDPIKILGKTFDEVDGYSDIILIKNIRLESHCEHHMVPFIGKAHIALSSSVVGCCAALDIDRSILNQWYAILSGYRLVINAQCTQAQLIFNVIENHATHFNMESIKPTIASGIGHWNGRLTYTHGYCAGCFYLIEGYAASKCALGTHDNRYQ